MPENDTNNQNTDDTQNQTNNNQTPNTNGSCVYDKWGRTPNKDMICAIGIKSAAADTQSGVVKCVFKNKCAHCGKPSLMWGWKWENDQEKIEKFDGTDGTAEGHIYCVQSEGGCDADFSIEGNEHINGSTAKLTVVSGPTPSSEEEAQQLSNGQLACDGSFVTPNASGGAAGGTAIKIPDLTFYGLIKQILGAVDGVFIIANNMAYLLSFKQLYYYRDKYEDYILELTPSDIITDSIVRNWTTDGFYNSVEVTYADGIIKMQHDALVETYGEQTFYYEFPDDDEETAKAKADALLSAHVRDYSLDLQLNCIYNPNITVGSWIKIPKTLTKVSGATSKTSGELAERDKDKKTLRKGVNITNINEIVQEVNNKQKNIQKITTEDGEKYEVEIEKKDYEIYFVQGYKLRWTPDYSPIMSLQLKYGPDTPEDPVNATIGTGGVSTSTSGGQFGSDCFTIGDFCINNNEIVMVKYMGGERAEELKGMLNSGELKITEEDKQARADQNASYTKKLSGKTPQEAYAMFRTEYNYSLYCDNATCWKCAGDFYDKAGKATNCGDTACLLKVFFDVTGTPCIGIHIGGHYFNAIQLNGSWEIIDGVRIDNQTCNFPDGTTGYTWENPCPCEIYGSGDCNTC